MQNAYNLELATALENQLQGSKAQLSELYQETQSMQRVQRAQNGVVSEKEALVGARRNYTSRIAQELRASKHTIKELTEHKR